MVLFRPSASYFSDPFYLFSISSLFCFNIEDWHRLIGHGKYWRGLSALSLFLVAQPLSPCIWKPMRKLTGDAVWRCVSHLKNDLMSRLSRTGRFTANSWLREAVISAKFS